VGGQWVGTREIKLSPHHVVRDPPVPPVQRALLDPQDRLVLLDLHGPQRPQVVGHR
jgi:hypothetical protein